MRPRIDRPMLDGRAGGLLAEVVVALPICRWTNRSRHETAPAIRANVVQNSFDTSRTESAFVRADARLQRFRRQRLVAILTSWSKFEHGVSSEAGIPLLCPEVSFNVPAPFESSPGDASCDAAHDPRSRT